MPPPLLISNRTNIRYLSGVNLTDGLMLVRSGKRAPLLFVDSRYTEKAADEAKRGIKVLHSEELPKMLTRFRRVRFEADNVTVAKLTRWKKRFKGTTFVPSEGVVEEWRRMKKSEEIKATKKACAITDDVLKEVPKMLSIGMSEKSLGWHIEKLSRECGADAMAFDTIVAFGSSTSRPHHRPTDRRLRKGDIVQIDMGVKVKGYCSDCSRIFFTAKPTEEQKQIFDLLLSIVKETTKMMKVGASNQSLDRYARKKMKEFSTQSRTRTRAPRLTAVGQAARTLDQLFLHSLGHGVGLDVHEGLNISSRAPKTKLLRNEIITTEPGIYFEGKWGMRIEDTILVTGNAGKSLTHAKYYTVAS